MKDEEIEYIMIINKLNTNEKKVYKTMTEYGFTLNPVTISKMVDLDLETTKKVMKKLLELKLIQKK
jgi:predicted transcriptional regulator